jgi:hypothetical protein
MTQRTGLNDRATLADAVSAIKSPANFGLCSINTAYLPTSWYLSCSQQAVTSSAGLGNNNVRVAPWVVTQTVSIIDFGLELITAGDANSIFRIGVWADNGLGIPSTLVLDAGSISTGSGNAGTVATGGTANPYALPVTLTLQPGLYWIGGAVQGAPSTQPTLRCIHPATILVAKPNMGTLLSNISGGAGVFGYSMSSQSGAFTTFVNNGVIGNAARIGFKTA